MITSAAKSAIHQVISVWETGSPTLRHGTISILADGAGFTGGSHQGTDAAGTIDRIVQTYIDSKGKYASEFSAFMDELESNLSTGLDPKNLAPWAVEFMALWRKAAAEDAWFCRAQDQVFDVSYWAPVAQQAESMKLILPVSWGICYDLAIQSGPAAIAKMRRLFSEAPPANYGDEKLWAAAMARARRKWLSEFTSPYAGDKGAKHTALVRSTVYRMDGWLDVIAKGNWQLSTPFPLRFRDKQITILG